MQAKTYSVAVRGVATVPFSFGFFGLCVFWWYPFGLILATIGFIIGFISNLLGIRSETEVHGGGDNLPFVGMVLCATVMTLIITLKFGIYFMLDQ